MGKMEFAVINEDRLAMFRAKYPKVELRSFSDWKSLGRLVRKGSKQKAYNLLVLAGYRNNPETGEMEREEKQVMVYGFTREQVQ